MSVGLPGAGIGGVFYLVSALVMPVREAGRALRGDVAAHRWRVVLRQVGMAAGVIAAIWAVGWLLGVVLGPRPAAASLGSLGSAGAGAPAEVRNVLRMAALIFTFGTLAAVLIAVQVLRFVVRRKAGRGGCAVASASTPVNPTCLLLFLVAGATANRSAAAQEAPGPRFSKETPAALSRADSAYRAGDRVLAERLYARVLSADPENSRATFRLAQLRRDRAKESIRLFRRYIALEPDDPWGYMALGDAYAGRGDFPRALDIYAQAMRRAPGERDAVVGRAALLGRAGRTDEALATYQAWLARHPADAEAWRELARQRQRAGRVYGAV
ncbi:MAG: tetratricopeptide repeat protein, partial [Gemmatimonadetes bacterium]|nr:tetratricopeptide repeat protein [Gemmatimonadota bacterium]